MSSVVHFQPHDLIGLFYLNQYVIRENERTSDSVFSNMDSTSALATSEIRALWQVF